jgi:aldose 1-epimerase
VVVEVGAGLRSYVAGGAPALDGYGETAMASSGRGQVLIPWPNRVEDGRYRWAGQDLQLPLTEVPNGNAIHGLVRWAAWTCTAREEARVVLEHVVHPQSGYPFTLELRIEYALGADGLRVTTTATNAGGEACPYGEGHHPYLTVGTATVDEISLTVPGSRVYDSGERNLPVPPVDVRGTAYDFRTARRIGGTVMDTCFADLDRGPDGLVRARLDAPDGRALELWAGDGYRYLQVFTGDPLADVRRRSLAVEPMTCPPNAFRTGTDVVRLEPGASFTGVWGISPRP